MKIRMTLALGVGLACFIGASVLAHDGFGRNKPFRIFALLQPTNEVPALSSGASGRFKATVDPLAETITYELSYDGLEGDVLQSHIHVGQHSVNGGISVFLCGNPPAVPAATVPQPPACPPPPATVTGVVTAASIIGPNGQGVAPTAADVNEFDELVALLRDGVTYANVHSAKFPGGEIRGQIFDVPQKGRD